MHSSEQGPRPQREPSQDDQSPEGPGLDRATPADEAPEEAQPASTIEEIYRTLKLEFANEAESQKRAYDMARVFFEAALQTAVFEHLQENKEMSVDDRISIARELEHAAHAYLSIKDDPYRVEFTELERKKAYKAFVEKLTYWNQVFKGEKEMPRFLT